MWDRSFSLDATAGRPLFLQVTMAVIGDIRRGRLRRGDRMPGSRALASQLGVSRITVATAYDELIAEGWLVSRRTSGTFVADDLPAEPLPWAGEAAEAQRARPAPLYQVPAAPPLLRWPTPAAGRLVFRSSHPDVRLAPTRLLAREYRRAIERNHGHALGYGPTAGHEALRAEIAQMLRSLRGLPVCADEILVTSGSQMALALTARGLLRPGDAVAVESFSYPNAWKALREGGARLVPVPVDAHGMDVERLASLAASERIAAVYLTPQHQLPTTVTLCGRRRTALLRLAAERSILVIEDDYDHEFHYDGPRMPPLASADTAGVVVYIGSLSKVLAPGLRLGYLAAPAPVVETLAAHRQTLDIQGDHAMQAAVAALLADGEVQRHIHRVSRIYHARRDLAVALLRKHLGSVLELGVPAGGMGLWPRVAPDVDVDDWASAARERGAEFLPARVFAVDGQAASAMRLGFASLNEAELETAILRLAAALPGARVVSGTTDEARLAAPGS